MPNGDPFPAGHSAFLGRFPTTNRWNYEKQYRKHAEPSPCAKFDRFAQTAIEGVQVVRELFERGIRVHILNMGLVENTLTGNLILTAMLAFAEYERGTIVERTQTGKAVARQDPNFRDGRPKKFMPEQIDLALSLLAQGKTYRQITIMTGISKSTLIRAKNQGA